MADTTLEERVRTLESRIDSLQQQINEHRPQAKSDEKTGWRAIVGTFANDPLYDEAMRLGREWRESDRDNSAEEGT